MMRLKRSLDFYLHRYRAKTLSTLLTLNIFAKTTADSDF